ncbi:MAG TPA: Asp-tRNA(Asn)/Glu-tRNA(Gln) amidotransferase subunit GatA [Bacillota bacterium]|nr:Asp-tRNA(Asn)/Glu-tRNA(Gln) amidotransferase subunit GatA [Bacillota bacterium]
MSLFDYSIQELEAKLQAKEITVQDIVDASFKQIEEVDGDVQAFLTLNEEQAREQAKKLDNTSERQQLFGMPVGIKDNIVTKGLKTTCGSQFLKNFDDPLYDATVIKKLHQAQAITIGKMNMDEFAMGSSTETSSYKQTRNPWNTDYVPGGSSGGSAAAVAAREVLFALGSDTGGSIRQPAAFCGVVGMKPTYGRVSRFGLVAFASSMDQIGPITRTVSDNARVLEVIAGKDEMDTTSASVPVPSYTNELTSGDLNGLKIAVPTAFIDEGVHPEVKEAVMEALKVYESLGASWEEVSLPHLKYAEPTYYLLSSAEASSSLARFDGIHYGVRSDKAEDMIDIFKKSRSEGFGEEVKRRIILGTFALSSGNHDAYVKKAQQVRTLIKQDFAKLFEDYDLVMGPTTPTPAFKFDAKTDDPVEMYASDMLTIPANLTGVPALSLPCGFSENGLPIGLQIIGKHFDEATIYRAAYAYEQATDHHAKRPTLGGKA